MRLEVSGTVRMAAVAIDFNRVARAFARSAAVFAVRLWRTTTRRVLTLFLIVCHEILLENDIGFEALD